MRHYYGYIGDLMIEEVIRMHLQNRSVYWIWRSVTGARHQHEEIVMRSGAFATKLKMNENI